MSDLTFSTAECECGHTTTIEPDGEYHVIPAAYLHVEPKTSTVEVRETWRYICAGCWKQLPDE